jgi:hypothetical protein
MPTYTIENDYGDRMQFRPERYVGHTYPAIFDNGLCQWVWSRLFCPRGWHLWDEMVNSESDHVLGCDACDVEFGVRKFESYR